MSLQVLLESEQHRPVQCYFICKYPSAVECPGLPVYRDEGG